MPAGYSGTPLPRKLGYEPGMRALLVDAPAEYLDWLGGAPEGVQFVAREALHAGEAGLIHLFATSAARLRIELPRLIPLLEERGLLWVSWPKKAAVKQFAIQTDITEDTIRGIALPLGLVDVKVCAVSEIWSGLKLVRRLR